MVYDETNACKDSKQLDEQNMTIYRPKNHLNETEGLRTDNIQVDPVKCRHEKLIFYDVIMT